MENDEIYGQRMFFFLWEKIKLREKKIYDLHKNIALTLIGVHGFRNAFEQTKVKLLQLFAMQPASQLKQTI